MCDDIQVNIGVVGSSGRSTDDSNLFNKDHMTFMKNTIMDYINNLITNEGVLLKNILLISGGSAWADHTVVQLYLENKVKRIQLFIPAFYRSETLSYHYNFEGTKLNKLHKTFSEICGIDSLKEIDQAIKKGALIHKGTNFTQRNTMIANKSEHLLAFTFNDGNTPSRGGTYDTWNKSTIDNKFHISLNLMKIND